MDDDVRTTERAWRASGSVDDHARHLTALVRAGRLAFPRLRLAAQLGHEPAKAAAEVVEPSWRPLVDHGSNELDVRIRLMDVLFEVEPEAAVVTAFALLDRAGLTDPLATGLVGRVRAWLVRRDAVDLAALGAEAGLALASRLPEPTPFERTAASSLLDLVRGAEAAGRAWDPEKPLPFRVLREAMERSGRSAPVREHWEVARVALLGWALGPAQ